MKHKVFSVFLISIIAFLVIVSMTNNSFLIKSNANGPVLELNNSCPTPGGVSSLSCTVSGYVTAGDSVIIIALSMSTNTCNFVATDSLGNTFNELGGSLVCASTVAGVYNNGAILYSLITTTGLDTITLTGYSTGLMGETALGVIEISGTSILSSVNSGSTTPSFNLVVPSFNLLTVTASGGIVECANGCTTPSFTATSGYTLFGETFPSGSFPCGFNMPCGFTWQYNEPTSSSSTLPMGFSGTGGSVAWTYIGITSNGTLQSLSPPSIFTITSIITKTGMLVPCFVGGSGCGNNGGYSWLLGMLFLLIPPSILSSMFAATDEGKRFVSNYAHVESNGMIFTMLFGLLIGSILGVMPTINALPLWTPFVFGVIFVIYMWKGRE